MDEIVRQIRKKLRLAMNGVVSTSMREKGIDYKINFGVSLPRLKTMATEFAPSAELASRLWKENVRELKILATLLYPASEFTAEQADEWVRQINNTELVEQFCMNLMQNTTFAKEVALRWIDASEEFVKLAGFILLTRLFMLKQDIDEVSALHILKASDREFEQAPSRLALAALNTLKRMGRVSGQNASDILFFFKQKETETNQIKHEIVEDLKFEFEYYR